MIYGKLGPLFFSLRLSEVVCLLKGQPLEGAAIMNIDHKGNQSRQICAGLKKLMGEKLMENLPLVRWCAWFMAARAQLQLIIREQSQLMCFLGVNH